MKLLPWILMRHEHLRNLEHLLTERCKELTEARTTRDAALRAHAKFDDAVNRATELESRADELEHDLERSLNHQAELLRALENASRLNTELMNDARRERGRIDDLFEQLAREHAAALEAVRSLSEGFARQLAELRRDGFNPMPAPLAPGWPAGTVPDLGPIARQALGVQDPAPAGPEGLDPEGRAVTWDQIVEAAQDRAGGNGNLYNTILGHAETWRAAKVPLAEIERRIWSGWEG